MPGRKYQRNSGDAKDMGSSGQVQDRTRIGESVLCGPPAAGRTCRRAVEVLRVLRALPATVLATVLATALAAGPGAPDAGPEQSCLDRSLTSQPTWPITAAFTYGWGQGRARATPLLGTDDTRFPAVARRHVATMRYMGMEAGISSWWGVGSASDQRIPNQLRAADGTPFRWALYYELEGPQYPDPSPAKIRADLTYVKKAYGADRSYLRVGGKPVLFVWAGPNDRCGMNARWRAANTLGFHVVLKRFQHFATCPDQPQSWHDYGPATPRARQPALVVLGLPRLLERQRGAGRAWPATPPPGTPRSSA